jgi:hypothetical protein
MMSEHAVIISFKYGRESLDDLFELESRLETMVDEAGVGELDGNEMAMDLSDGSLYLYGPDADVLFQTVLPTLEAVPFMQDAVATLRYGPPEKGVPERQVRIGAGRAS